MKERCKKKVRDEIFKKFNGHCAYCGCDIKRDNFQIDHIIPLQRGTTENHLKTERGSNELNNYNPSCISCNSSKGQMSFETWRKELALKKYRLNRDVPQYRLMKRFGLIREVKKSITFYFEEISNGRK